ncbi:MAG TPA: 30S ribosomal protein S3ae [Methanomicrobiales archaeon]|nr:30S ribosomal protein S3ae [Methanomicrobiales archaeon]
MAKKKQVGRKVEGWKAKNWYKVYVPEIFGRTYIGDTISSDAATVVGRVMGTTLGEIVQDYARQNVKLKIKITNVAGDAAYTDFIGHELTRDYLRSIVKRRMSRIDLIIPITTKDGKRVQLTTTCFTLSRANSSQVHSIRDTMTNYLITHAGENDFNTIVKEIVSGDLAKELHKSIKEIYPIRRVEIIKSEVQEIKQEMAVPA